MVGRLEDRPYDEEKITEFYSGIAGMSTANQRMTQGYIDYLKGKPLITHTMQAGPNYQSTLLPQVPAAPPAPKERPKPAWLKQNEAAKDNFTPRTAEETKKLELEQRKTFQQAYAPDVPAEYQRPVLYTVPQYVPYAPVATGVPKFEGDPLQNLITALTGFAGMLDPTAFQVADALS